MPPEAREAYLQRRRHEIGQRLKAIRRRKKLSQDDVAVYLGCSRITVARVESGVTEFTVGELELLAKLFDVTVLHFLGLAVELTVSLPDGQKQFTFSM